MSAVPDRIATHLPHPPCDMPDLITRDSFSHTLRAVVLSLGISQIVGTIVFVAQIIDAFKNLYLLVHQSIAIWKEPFVNTHKIEAMKCLRHNIVEDLKNNVLRSVAALISVIPIVGLIGAGGILTVMDPESISQHATTTDERMAEAVAHHLLGSLPKIGTYLNLNLHFLKGVSLEDYNKNKTGFQKARTEAFRKVWDVQKIQIPVERGDNKPHHITCNYIRRNGPIDKSAPTALLFHPNAETADGLLGVTTIRGQISLEKLRWFSINTIDHLRNHGWNVLMPTMGGYPGSDPGVETNEISVIQDVNAVLKKLDQDGVSIIQSRGISYGGALAMHATQISDKIKMLVLENTFDNPVHASGIMFDEILRQIKFKSMIRSLIAFFFPLAVIRGLARSILPLDRMVPGVKTKGGLQYMTDGHNNVKKMESYSQHLCVLAAIDDELMSVSRREPDPLNTPSLEQFQYSTMIYRRNLAERLYIAHQQQPAVKNSEKVISRYIETGGGHMRHPFCIKKNEILAYSFAMEVPLLENKPIKPTTANVLNAFLGINLG